MGGFGLTIGINADPSQAQAAIASVQAQTQQAFGEGGVLPAAISETNESFINAHQSVHLLAEEAGIHLPRAVVSAVSEMIPQITELGNVLLGAFAVHMVVDFIEKMKAATEEFNGVKEAARQMEEEIKANERAIDDLAKTSSRAAQQQLLDINRRIGATHDEAVALRAVNEMYIAQYGYFGLLALKAGEYLGVIKPLAEVEKLEHQQEKLRDELAKIMTEDVKRESEAVKRHAAALHEHISAEERAAQAAARHQQQLTAELTRYQTLPELVRHVTEELNREAEAQERMKRAQLDIELHTRVTKQEMEQLNQVLNMVVGTYEQATVQVLKLTTAEQLEAAIADSKVQSFERQISGMVALIAGRRAAAAVEAVWETAQGFASLGEYDFWAAAQHFLSAAQYGIVAGAGAGGGSAGGAAAAGARNATYEGAPGAGVTGSYRGGGGPRGESAVHFNFYGGVISADTLQQFTAQLSQSVRNGQVTLTASNALITGPKLT
jgi:hypothetical protein